MPQAPSTTKRKADSDENIAAIIKDIIGGKTKPGKYSEGTIKGLFLKVSSTSQLWRLKFSLNGEEGSFSIGAYPDISVAKARVLAQEARTAVAEGVHPLKVKAAKREEQRTKEENTFRKVAADFLEFRSDLATQTLSGHRGVLKNHLYPIVGDLPVADITFKDVKSVLNRLNASPTIQRHALDLLRMVLNYAVNNELIEGNVAAGRTNLLKKHKTTHHAALETPSDLAEFLRRLNNFVAYNDSAISALWMLVMLPVRPSELTAMRWSEVNLKTAEWRYTVPKTGQPHIVPLPTQAVAQLRALQEHSLSLGRKGATAAPPFGKTAASESAEPSGWVFPSSGKFGRPISADTLLVRIRTGLGYERGTITSHGFRSTFRSLGHEVLKADPIVLELCLGHCMPGALGATYMRGTLLERRRDTMQDWADYVEKLWASVAGTDDENDSV